jgi:cephalosporin-C deacetylase-like acetyl esterase
MILNYLATRDDLDMKHVGMLGHGSGGSVAILAAAADPRIVALHVIDPWGDWPDWLKGSKQIPEAERATYLKPKFLEDVANLDPVLYLPQCKCKALRIEQLTNDPVTPPVARDKIAGAAPRTDVVQRYPDRSAEVQAWGPSGVSTWLAAQLKPNEPGKE